MKSHEKCAAEVPVFVSCVKVNLEASSRVAKKRCRKRAERSSLFGIPSQQGSEVHRTTFHVVDFGIDRCVRDSAEQRDGPFQLGIAPAVALRDMQCGVES